MFHDEEPTGFNSLRVGQKGTDATKISIEMINAYANVSKDFNKLHMSTKAAQAAGFKNRILHGAFLESFWIHACSNILNGKSNDGFIHRKTTKKFKKPACLGDTVITTATVSEIMHRIRKVTFAVTSKVDNDIVSTGTISVLFPPEK